ncbi:uncharacterized protein BDZ99DRAFT_466723 [Mytilinidion resinicola]|uniref:Uncharacterized protein n=1 Tax=Mytilinidion resinicola TaxID=574789 RepID=A0A6A6Y8B4_9PEZI|nr:uncharacterized protein BDZ99DRAFT_466723 [Mytilinidion resinicola]KAF2805052.1 hypothetical protein BDZ99DRAFT_466723 [Mytilinidion resinicola]
MGRYYALAEYILPPLNPEASGSGSAHLDLKVRPTCVLVTQPIFDKFINNAHKHMILNISARYRRCAQIALRGSERPPDWSVACPDY